MIVQISFHILYKFVTIDLLRDVIRYLFVVFVGSAAGGGAAAGGGGRIFGAIVGSNLALVAASRDPRRATFESSSESARGLLRRRET